MGLDASEVPFPKDDRATSIACWLDVNKWKIAPHTHLYQQQAKNLETCI